MNPVPPPIPPLPPSSPYSVPPEPRPQAITVICILCLLGSPLGILLVFSEAARLVGAWYPPYLALSCIIGFACMIGLWKMRKWAAVTYAGFVALNQIVLLATGHWSIMSLIVPGAVSAIALAYLPKMH